MLNFSINLSIQSVQILFNLIELTEYIKENPDITKKRENYINKWAEFTQECRYPHFVTHSRTLRNEGLIGSEDKGAKSDKNSFKKWIVTPKGYLIAEILKIEFNEAKELTKQLHKLKEMKQLNGNQKNQQR